MFKHRMEIVHMTMTTTILIGCFTIKLYVANIFPMRESTSIMSGNGKGFTLEELFRSPFTEL